MSLRPGLCSVTFRDREVPEVVDLAVDAGLACIEWGGDVHVPHGDLAAAAVAAEATRSAGLDVASYGSYLCADDDAGVALPAVLDTAETLGAPAIRVWAPFGIEPDAGAEAHASVARALTTIAGSAAERNMAVYLEFHGGTLTATARSAVGLLHEVGADNLLCGWQPPYWDPQPVESDVADLALLAPSLAHLHVYAWLPDGTREALAAEDALWPTRLVTAGATPPVAGLPRAALLEFVADDDPAAFVADARTLRRWLGRFETDRVGPRPPPSEEGGS